MPQETGIAENVARLRLDRQLTQAALAEGAGLSRLALGRIERGVVVPRAGTLAALGRGSRGSGPGADDSRSAAPERPVPRSFRHVRAGTDSRGGIEMAGRLCLAGGRTR